MRLIDADELNAEFDLIASKSATDNWQTIPIKHIKQIIDNAPTVKSEIPQGDLISRSALKQMIPAPIEDEYKRVHHIIDNAPTVSFMISPDYATELQNLNKELIKQLEEVEKPQGEWIDYDNTFYKCPDCGYLLEKCCPRCQNKVILPKGGAK